MCIILQTKVDRVLTSGVYREVKEVYRNRKRLPTSSFRMVPETTLGPRAVQVDLVKTDTAPEELMFVYR